MGQKGTVSFSYRSASGFVFAVFLAVALPTVSCALGARWIDQYFATGYFFTILGIFLAFAISAYLVLHLAKRFLIKRV